MVKAQITITIEQQILKRVDSLLEDSQEFAGASRSYVIEKFVRESLKSRSAVAIAH